MACYREYPLSPWENFSLTWSRSWWIQILDRHFSQLILCQPAVARKCVMVTIRWHINFNFFHMKACSILHVIVTELNSLHLERCNYEYITTYRFHLVPCSSEFFFWKFYFAGICITLLTEVFNSHHLYMYIYVGHLQCYLKNALVEKCLAHSHFICKYFITQHVAVVECILKYLSDQDDFKLVSLYFSSLQIYYNNFFFKHSVKHSENSTNQTILI